MGSGKTTVAGELARELNCRAVDLDDLITKHEKRSPKEIIEQNGEDSFREIETQMLCTVLTEKSACVIALGGGAWTIAANRKLIAEHGAFTIWLDAPFELCWRRIQSGDEGRPLARSREMARQLYAERRPIYMLAETRIQIDENQSAEDTTTQIAHALLQQNMNT